MLRGKMKTFQEFVRNRIVAETIYDNNIDLKQYLDQVESGNYNEEQIVSEILNAVGNAIGAVAGAATRGVNNFVQGTKSGYNWANPQQNAQQPNTTQQNAQQPNATQQNAQQPNPQQQQQRAKVVTQLQQQLQALSKSLPALGQQLQTLSQLN
jgi:hypothetical protein